MTWLTSQSGVRGARRDDHEEQAEEEGPEAEPLGLGDLAVQDGLGAPARGRRLAGDGDGAALRERLLGEELGGAALEAARLLVGRVLGRTQLRDGAPLAGVLELAAARAALGGLDLPLPLEEDRFAAQVFRFLLPQGAGTGSLHRFSLFSPAGLADGLALKELRYALRRFAPGRPAILGSPRPDFPPGLRLRR